MNKLELGDNSSLHNNELYRKLSYRLLYIQYNNYLIMYLLYRNIYLSKMDVTAFIILRFLIF